MEPEYVKDFDGWGEKKKLINERENIPVFKEREIWWCSLGCNIGSEEDGKHEDFLRPVIIFRIFNKSILWAIPLTTKEWPPESRIHYMFVCNGKNQTAEIHQLRLISSKRLVSYLDTISYEDFQNIRRYIVELA